MQAGDGGAGGAGDHVFELARMQAGFEQHLAEPSSVCAASSVARSRGNPMRTPPSESASIMTATNAGPLPLKPVTASSSFSGTCTARPTLLQQSLGQLHVRGGCLC